VHTPLCLQVSGCPEVEDDKESGALVKKLLMKVLGFCSETVIRAWHLDEPDGRRPVLTVWVRVKTGGEAVLIVNAPSAPKVR